MSAWTPNASFEQVDQILCGPGMPYELETRVIDGRVQRVYKNLFTSTRNFWLWATNEHSDKTYVVFEEQRYTFKEMRDLTVKIAAMFQENYGIQKGDRVAICSRNYPSFFAAFWACHLLGAVPVLVNAWLPMVPLKHCLLLTAPKLMIFDTQRADMVEPIVSELNSAYLVLESHEGKGTWSSMQSFTSVLNAYTGHTEKILQEDPNVLPEDNATVIFTSGTTGLPKGVLSTQRQFLSVLCNGTAPTARAMIRMGMKFPPEAAVGPEKGYFLPTPAFHVTGTAIVANACAGGIKLVLMRKWNVEKAVDLVIKENIVYISGVPTTLSDLVDSRLAKEGHSFETMTYGGAPLAETLARRSADTFPRSLTLQAYGLTETNATTIAAGGPDFMQRPTSTGLALPATEVIIVKDGVQVATGGVGEIWVRGPNIMKEYWGDRAATEKVLTKDGWFKTGDLGCVDAEGFVYIKDRMKDIIIRGGENIDSVSVESALYNEPGVLEAAAVGVPDQRLGELVTALVTLKPGYIGKVNEKTLLAMVKKILPHFAIPVMIVVHDKDFEHTPSGKILKPQLRVAAKDEWERRTASRARL